jgi:hypothetical protein
MRATFDWLKSHNYMKGSTMQFTTFATWDAVLEAATHNRLWYHAPLDRRPTAVGVVKVFKNRKIRIRASGLTFTADEGHLDRFRTLVIGGAS